LSPQGAAQALLLGLAGIAVLAGPAAAESKRTDPLTTIWNAKLRPDPAAMPDFVEKSRPTGEQNYMPLTAPEPERPVKRKTPDELKAMQADLEAAGAVNRRRAGRASKTDSAKSSGKVSTVRSGAAAPIH
jgi:hypothetical protein